eukprot:9662851-Lingulodinium_polyedra.AAC.1
MAGRGQPSPRQPLPNLRGLAGGRSVRPPGWRPLAEAPARSSPLRQPGPWGPQPPSVASRRQSGCRHYRRACGSGQPRAPTTT